MNPEPFASIAVLCTDDRQRAAADALCRRGYVVERLIPGESDPLLLAQTDFCCFRCWSSLLCCPCLRNAAAVRSCFAAG